MIVYYIEYLVAILYLFFWFVCLIALFSQELLILDRSSLLDICNVHVLLVGSEFFKVSSILKRLFSKAVFARYRILGGYTFFLWHLKDVSLASSFHFSVEKLAVIFTIVHLKVSFAPLWFLLRFAPYI